MFAALLAFLVGVSDMCMSNRYEVNRMYADAFQLAGCDTVLICRSTDTNSLRRIVRALDLVVFTGGKDVDPARYGEPNIRSWPDQDRDAYDFALMAACVAEKKPIFGICRGCQLINAFFGGTLVQDIPSMWQDFSGRKDGGHGIYCWTGAATNPPTHTVSFVPDSRLGKVCGTAPLPTTSYHHQCVKKVAPGFRVVATAPDGVPEAIEHETLPIFGVQFHPEIVAVLRPKGYDIERHLAFFRQMPGLCGR